MNLTEIRFEDTINDDIRAMMKNQQKILDICRLQYNRMDKIIKKQKEGDNNVKPRHSGKEDERNMQGSGHKEKGINPSEY